MGQLCSVHPHHSCAPRTAGAWVDLQLLVSGSARDSASHSGTRLWTQRRVLREEVKTVPRSVEETLWPTESRLKYRSWLDLTHLHCMCFFWLSGRPTLMPTYSWTGNGVTRPRTPMALALVLAITALRGTYLNRIYASCTMR